MKPLPSERQLFVEVVRAVVAHPKDCVLLEEGRGKSGISGRKATQTTTLSQGRGCGHIAHTQGPASDL